MLDVIQKRDGDVLDYDADFALWLPEGDALDTATAEVTDTTVVVDSVVVSEERVKVWLSGGADGESGTLTITATTLNGRTKEICFRIRVKGC